MAAVLSDLRFQKSIAPVYFGYRHIAAIYDMRIALPLFHPRRQAQPQDNRYRLGSRDLHL